MNSTNEPNSFLILQNAVDRSPSFELFNELLKYNKKRDQFNNLLHSIFKNLFTLSYILQSNKIGENHQKKTIAECFC